MPAMKLQPLGRRFRPGAFLTGAFLVVALVVQLFPLYWLVLFSFKSNQEIFGGNIIGFPAVWRFQNYERALLGGKLGQYFLNSVVVSGVSVLAATIASSMAAFALSRLRFKLSKAVLVFFLMGTMIPLHATLLPLFLVLRELKLMGGYLSLIVPYAAFGLPISIFIFEGFFQSIPREMEESAFMDGATVARTFVSIMAPLIRPAIATVGIFTFLTNWNELMFATTFVSSAEYKTLPVGIMGLTSQYRTEWGPIGAALIVASLPTVLIYSLLSRQVQEGVRAGAVKG